MELRKPKTRAAYRNIQPEDDSSSASDMSIQLPRRASLRRSTESRNPHTGNSNGTAKPTPATPAKVEPAEPQESGPDEPDSPVVRAGRSGSARRERRVVSDRESSGDDEDGGWMRTANQVVARLLQDSDVRKVFGQPVDPEALGLDDYLRIIKSPMDLGTVQKKLNPHTRNQRRERYAGPDDFVRDVHLTFNNAMQYNPPADHVYLLAADQLAFLARHTGLAPR